MQALKMIPKVLENIEDIHRNSGQDTVLTEYKKNIKSFLQQVSAEVSSIINKYESIIKSLKEQNQILKNSGKDKKDNSPYMLPLQSPVKRRQSPSNQFVKTSKMRSTNLDLMQTAKSHIFTPYSTQFDQPKLSKVLSKYRKNNQDDNNFPMELINPEPSDDNFMAGGKSRFQVKSNKKKQREQELVCFLQTGRKNLHHTTDQFMDSIGRGKRYESQDNKNQVEVNNNSESSNSKNKEQMVNKSLSNICNSLDNSTVAKKARNSKKKRSNQLQQEALRKMKQQEELTKMLKNKGIKNILSQLRENVQNSGIKPVEIIKSSKLISCGGGVGASSASPVKNSNKSGAKNDDQQSVSLRKRNSKVMINPVPVDIVKKSMVSMRQGNRTPPSPTSPQKRPQSILKTSNILGRSLSGISAIQFHD